MKNLEKELGYELLCFKCNKIEITDRGMSLYNKTNDILNDLMNKIEINKEIEFLNSGLIRIAIDYDLLVEFESVFFSFLDDFEKIQIKLFIYSNYYDISVIDFDFVFSKIKHGGVNVIIRNINNKSIKPIYIIYNSRLIIGHRLNLFFNYIKIK
ncbi:hypothetical protein [Photobacterium piscicola]|uniref:hypothetical protein n=1 Tax=Photobacterium piscicola TaxID=1378299 RepID=UPI00373636AA